mgnify:CR=1 FL=1
MKDLTESLRIIGECLEDAKTVEMCPVKMWYSEYAPIYKNIGLEEFLLCYNILDNRRKIHMKVEVLEHRHHIDILKRISFMKDLGLSISVVHNEDNTYDVRFPQLTMEKYYKFLSTLQSNYCN